MKNQNRILGVVLGSTSAIKISAVEKACKQLRLEVEVRGIAVASRQNEQPFGLQETSDGAYARAMSVKESATADIYVGIESGLVEFLFGGMPCILDIAFVAIILADGRKICTTSSGVEFGYDSVSATHLCDFKHTTIGKVIENVHGGNPNDPHLTVTNGKVSREATLVSALKIALRQI